MQQKDYIFWVGLPPAAEDLGLLLKSAGLAEPLLDLRYGSIAHRKHILQEAIRQELGGITVFADSRDSELSSSLLELLPQGSRIILTQFKRYADNFELFLREFKKRGIVMAVEVDNKEDAGIAAAAGADFLVASGNEAYGKVSEKTSLILIQELLECIGIPLVIRGSLGPQGAAAALAAGCSGCILDSQLLLLDDSPVDNELKKLLQDKSPSDTYLLGAFIGEPYRFLWKGNRDEYNFFVEAEKKAFLQDAPFDKKIAVFEGAAASLMYNGFVKEATILPVGQGIAFSQQFAKKGLRIREVLKVYRSALETSIAKVKDEYPFLPDSPLAVRHKVKYPIVQGPMACISGNPRLAAEVAKAGALPFISLAGLSPQESSRLINETRLALADAAFGVGIVNFSSPEKIDEQISVLLSFRPDFVTIAGTNTDVARRLEQSGISVYAHAPTLSHLNNLLDDKISGVILEGRESGGHIGALGSLVLWELGITEILNRNSDPICLTRVLLAGGIASARGAFAAAVLASAFIDQKALIGLQLGTAYLMTEEVVESGALPAKYRDMLLKGNDTVSTGCTVNLPTRWLFTPAVEDMIASELSLEKQGLTLSERKDQLEQLNINCLRKALNGSGQNGAYMCGQAVTLRSRAFRIIQLHEELTQVAQFLAQACPMPDTVWKIPEDTIAIIGMGCIFPDANNPQEYWNNIISRRCSIREIPNGLWNAQLHYSPIYEPYKTYSKIGAYIDGFKKDPLKFRIPPVSAPFIEYAQFLMLEVAHQALRTAGYLDKDFPRERTAVFVGSPRGGQLNFGHIIRSAWDQFAESLRCVPEFLRLPLESREAILAKAQDIFNRDLPGLSEDSCGGIFNSIIASRVCNCFDLKGTSLTVDAACASSLAAVDLGVRGLQERKFDLALVGAVDDNLSVSLYFLFSSLGALSGKGSFPFDERADGLVLGQGAGAILLKRLDDAIRDGDKVYAVIRSIDTSSDGRVKGITAPDAEGQFQCLQRSYDNVLFTPDTLGFIEAHGTGTRVGDLTEITALTRFIRRYSQRKKSIGIGSVKSMIGHLKCAAGIAGIIKVILSLQNETLPPTINCEQPRKDIDWDNSPFYLITESRPWKAGLLPRRAAVDAFGFGGINFHAVLEEAPPREVLMTKKRGDSQEDIKLPAEIFVFRSPSRKELFKLVENMKDRLVRPGQVGLHDIAIRLSENISSQGPTLAVVAGDVDELIQLLDKALKVLGEGRRREFYSAQGIFFSEIALKPGEKVAFLFPGFGSQYVNMAGDLPDYFPFIDEIFRKVDSIASRSIPTSILPILSSKTAIAEEAAKLANILRQPDYIYPVMVALEMGILEVFLRVGIQPDMTAGHSLGEYLALHAAGVFDAQTVIKVAVAQGEIIARHSSFNGAMVSINNSEEELSGILKQADGLVYVAAKNCPAQTVISGDIQAIESVLSILSQRGMQYTRLPTEIALHTPLHTDCVKLLQDFLQGVMVNPPIKPVYSSLTGRAYQSDPDFSSRLRNSLPRHLIMPVEFIKNILSLYEDGARLFIEIGPGSTLSPFVDNILVDKPHWAVVTNQPHRSATLQILHVLAFCIAHGLPVDINRIIQKKKQYTFRSTTNAVTLKAPVTITPERPKAPAAPDLVGEAFSGQDASVVDSYLKNRGSFLREMLRSDFQHFAGKATAEATGESASVDELEKRIVDLISRKTGYPIDAINIDFDVEAELGLDSIKQVELIREVGRELDISFGEDLKSQRFKITTPRKLIEVCRDLIAQKPDANQNEPSVNPPQIKLSDQNWHTNCHRWVSEKIEVSLPKVKDREAVKERRILILGGEGQLSRMLKAILEKAGAIVTIALPSHSPEGLPDDFSLIINLWGFKEDTESVFDRTAEWWSGILQRTEAVLKIGKKLAGILQHKKRGTAVWVEVNSAKHTSAQEGIGLGMIRCLSSEFSGSLESLYLDFDIKEHPDFIAESILNELSCGKTRCEVSYSGSKRYEIHWKIDDLPNQASPFSFGPDSVILAIGGSRGITASICKELAKRSHARFVIVGRSPVSIDDSSQIAGPLTFDVARNALLNRSRDQGKRIVPAEVDRLAWQQVWKEERYRNMNDLRPIAGRVDYCQCDITDPGGVSRLINKVWKEYGRIDLVIHGASDLIEKSILEIETNEFTENMKSKALGMACLLSALSKVKIGTFVNLSSIAGRWGNMGQGSYAAGHEIAAALVAAMRSRFSGKWVNIFFGPWLNVGMTRRGAVMERLSAAGSDFITEEAGKEFFIRECASGFNHNVAFCGKASLRLVEHRGNRMDGSRSNSFLDHIDRLDSEAFLGRRVFDLKRDRFVAEHYAGYNIPILPGVVSLEMIAQTASVLISPEFAVTDITDIVFPHPGIFPRNEPKEFYARTRLLSKDERSAIFSGEVFSLFIPPGSSQPQEMCHSRCKMRFGYRQPAQEPIFLLVSTGLGDCSVDAKPLQKTQMRKYRQGMFNSIHSFSSVTREGVVGEILASQAQEFSKHPYLDNPLRIDGLMDLVNLSTDIFLGYESRVLGSIKKIELFTSGNQGESRFCRTRICQANEAGFVYEVEAMDKAGKVTERISGIQKPMVRGYAEQTEPIWEAMRQNPRQKEIRQILDYKGKLILAQLDTLLVKGSLEAYKNALLQGQLSAEELKQYRRLMHPKRSLEWLAGRIVAKAAVRMYLDKDAPFASELEIRTKPSNSPYVTIAAKGGNVILPYISISHTSNIAIASAAQEPGIGIDTEGISESILEISDEFCADKELRRVMECVGLIKPIALTNIWTIKEASLKAVEAGSCPLKEIVLEKVKAYEGYIIAELFHKQAGQIKSVSFRSNKNIFAVSLSLERNCAYEKSDS